SRPKYEAALRSDQSLILIYPPPAIAPQEIFSVDLQVGSRIYDAQKSTPFHIPEKGIVVPPGGAVVIYTQETVGIPLNVFGMLFGKGQLIYRGAFISTGKIDPGFCDQLR